MEFFSPDLQHHLTSREVFHFSLATNAHIAPSPVALKCPDCCPQLVNGSTMKNLLSPVKNLHARRVLKEEEDEAPLSLKVHSWLPRSDLISC
ncbi:hypothetical protein TorRG33x02_204430 [Trema orientale]|uniref:Uncharacterized protein n=1 Tax=Trema orientale TaxID=63057 RepID=A0A2P5EE20_TREOI|nr:hypothetical protein TorRG33x02_204430 [Trema orientale]